MSVMTKVRPMDAAQSGALTMEEIRERYNQEWALLGNPSKSSNGTIEAGVVLWHTPNREEIWRKAKEISLPQNIAVLWIGDWPYQGSFAL